MWAMSTTVDAIYEHGIFRPISGVPVMLKVHERVRITIEADDEKVLRRSLLNGTRRVSKT